jgi:flagellar basal body-associated protein FliL
MNIYSTGNNLKPIQLQTEEQNDKKCQKTIDQNESQFKKGTIAVIVVIVIFVVVVIVVGCVLAASYTSKNKEKYEKEELQKKETIKSAIYESSMTNQNEIIKTNDFTKTESEETIYIPIRKKSQ